ncbi:MAG TPA: D-sedoheptulose 7-phosphate isomerase [Anaerolineales bacterium]|nr:D-sedoheptulose 7-phosphate isomerase [Anaerolineales bacterium]
MMETNNPLSQELEAHISALRRTVTECGPEISNITKCLLECFRQGNKLLLCGNGGSAADAQHIAAEFINRFRFDRPALPAISLASDNSILTCIGNDSAFVNIFSRQVEALGVKGDILVGISTSGRSGNVLKALETARAKGLTTIGFTGEKGRAAMGAACDYCLVVPSAETARIQECHEFVWHAICRDVESDLFQ